MVKKVTSRKKTVMQDVNPDVEERIENFTDPDRIKSAKAKIIDYAKIAEKFGSDSDLPDDDGDDVMVAPPKAIVVPAASSLDENEALLASLEGDSVQVAGSRADDDISDLSDFEYLHDSKKTPASAAIDDFNLDDMDTDLMDGEDAGSGAFIASSEDDDDIFGVAIPSVSAEPTPYGDKASSRSRNEVDDPIPDFKFDEDDGIDPLDDLPDEDLPKWQEDEGINDVFTAMNARRAADVEDDEEQGIFAADEESTEQTEVIRTTRVEASPTALADVMGIDDEPVIVPVASETVKTSVETPDGDTVVTTTKKKGFLSFGKKNKAAKATDSVAVPVAAKEKKGLFGRKKKVTEKVESNVLGDEVTTVTSEDKIELANGDEAIVKDVKVKKKSNGMLKMAASVVALAAMLGGGYLGADMLGFIPHQNAPVAVVKKPAPADNNLPAAISSGDKTAATLPNDNNDSKTVVASPAEGVDKKGTDNLDLNVVVKEPVKSAPEPQQNALDIERKADGSIKMTVPVTDPKGGGAASATLSLPDLDSPVQPKTVTATTSGDSVPANSELDDLFSAGTSQSAVLQDKADAAIVNEQIAKVSKILDDQKVALTAATDRLKALETIIADKDEALAAARDEASKANEAAKEAREMAIAQNNVLVEVVGVQDKMKIAEELIVDLSRRTAAIEADNSQVEQMKEMNNKINELNHSLGLLARTVITNGKNLQDEKAAQAAAEAAHEAAQAAVDAEAQAIMDRQTSPAPAGSGKVYANEKTLMTTPTKEDAVEIPDDVKVGDELPIFGKVLEITNMEDGSRLVVMENNSKILPRKE